MSKIRNPEMTRKKLLDALQRLVDGIPQRVDCKCKISIKSVQEEAGLSLGSAYRYPDIIDAIEIEKSKQLLSKKNERKRTFSNDLSRLRQEKAKETALKEKYREELNEVKHRLDQVYAEQNMQLMAMFNLLDIEDKARLLKVSGSNVISIK